MMEPDRSQALRSIPSLDAFLRRERLAVLPRAVVSRESREFLDEVRGRVLAGELEVEEVDGMFASDHAEDTVVARCRRARARHHTPVINATGIVLHTGIGRAPLAPAAAEACAAAAGYAIVEVDPVTGLRNQREVRIAGLLGELLDVEGGLVVNNNAAATTLVLAALAAGREVITSRGELVEIGGGFRVPEVMRQAGCTMVEVGATNRTHLEDFARAITDHTALLLKVHTSNFRLVGFHGVPPLAELAVLAHRHGLHAVEDLGSGLICREPVAGLVHEPSVQDSLATGVDLVCFSGDKLLGGPQCGILVGSADLVARCRAHPLYRAFRCDKLTLSALEATLMIYRDGDPLAEIPVLAALSRSVDELLPRAEALRAALADSGGELTAARVVHSQSFAGSGANPAHPIASLAVALPGGDRLCDQLRNGSGVPVFARIEDGHVLLDLRSLEGQDLEFVAEQVRMKLDPGAIER
ncbi:MAG: L-seryl-tRNA(Sec) selenium transferase [Planctomycetes bacterium]|nr:L-seryl-tRNA(Sec) selenium transferase [Planctomycetota bacterium]